MPKVSENNRWNSIGRRTLSPGENPGPAYPPGRPTNPRPSIPPGKRNDPPPRPMPKPGKPGR